MYYYFHIKNESDGNVENLQNNDYIEARVCLKDFYGEMYTSPHTDLRFLRGNTFPVRLMFLTSVGLEAIWTSKNHIKRDVVEKYTLLTQWPNV